MRRSVTLLLTAALVVGLPGSAQAALPDEEPVTSYGVDGKVRTLLQVGSNVWVGGRFTQVVANGSGSAVTSEDEVNLAAFDAVTGAPVDIGPDLGGVSGAIVYDLSLGPDGRTVYAAGKFKANGATNLIAFDGVTGAVTATYSTRRLFAAHADTTGVYGGGAKLWEVTSPTAETVIVSVATVDIGGHVRRPQVVDIETAPQGGLFIACKCDSIDDGSGSEPAKAFAHINADGTYDTTTWAPGNLLTNDGAAFGWEVAVQGTRTYLAAGGSDFVMAVDTADGRRRWLTDTDGSAQTVAYWSDSAGDRVIVGGHWRIITDASGDYCQPRLAALDPATGAIDRAWHPAPNPKYNGVWSVIQSADGRSVWVGGEFKKIAEDWVRDVNACVYIRDDPRKPKPAKPNIWARAIGKLAA